MRTMIFSLRRARPLTAAVALGLAGSTLSGCNLEVSNPGPIADADLNTPTAMTALVNGMGGDLSYGLGNYVMRGALASFELVEAGNYAAERKFWSGAISSDDVNTDWANLQRARWVAETGIARMKTVLGTGFESNPLTARAYLYAGFANRVLGENVCETTIDGGPRKPNSEHFVRAESLFTRALTISTALNNTAYINAALSGRAQVRANLGKWTDAAADAALVPVAFRHNAIFGATGREQLTLAYETITRRETTVWNTMWVADRDIRVPYDTVKTGTTITKGQDGATNFFRQKKYLTLGDPVALAKGTDMLLIRAEAALRANDVTNAMAFINQERASFTLPALTATTVDQVWPILQRERGAVLWLEGRRLWDLRRWLADGKSTQLQGRSACMPISAEELGANVNLR